MKPPDSTAQRVAVGAMIAVCVLVGIVTAGAEGPSAKDLCADRDGAVWYVTQPGAGFQRVERAANYLGSPEVENLVGLRGPIAVNDEGVVFRIHRSIQGVAPSGEAYQDVQGIDAVTLGRSPGSAVEIWWVAVLHPEGTVSIQVVHGSSRYIDGMSDIRALAASDTALYALDGEGEVFMSRYVSDDEGQFSSSGEYQPAEALDLGAPVADLAASVSRRSTDSFVVAFTSGRIAQVTLADDPAMAPTVEVVNGLYDVQEVAVGGRGVLAATDDNGVIDIVRTEDSYVLRTVWPEPVRSVVPGVGGGAKFGVLVIDEEGVLREIGSTRQESTATSSPAPDLVVPGVAAASATGDGWEDGLIIACEDVDD